MRALVLGSFLLFAAPVVSLAQMTMQQRVDDFNYLTALLNRNYAPYEWKRQVFGFDLLETKPWIERVRAARTDAEFYDICIEYIGNLNDYYTYLDLPSDFEAYLGFTGDLYDNKLIVESIDRTQLPSSRYNIALGDEVISIDGRSVESLLNEYGKFVIDSNPKSTRRAAADFLTYRLQRYMPRAAEIGETSRVEILKASDGSTVTLNLPWSVLGTPMRVGPVPDFSGVTASSASAATPYYQKLLSVFDRAGRGRTSRRELSASAIANAESTDTAEVTGIGRVAPLYALPDGFQTRVGRLASDTIYSGWYESGGKRIGLLRIPAFSTATAFFNQLDTEIAWLNDNTDVLVLDQMRDRLTSLCSSERVAARFVGKSFLQPGFEFRATWSNVLSFELALESALDSGADDATIDGLTAMLADLRTAYSENRGRTGAFPFCGTTIERQPALDRNGRVINYTKPILLVTDELSSDFLAATLKDAGRVTQFGTRTRGVLGTSIAVPGPAFSEMNVYIKDSLLVRAAPAKSPGYPDSPYVESAGVAPEIVEDFMTLENFRQRGVPFAQAMTRAALGLLQ
jgi:hypothetical protein